MRPRRRVRAGVALQERFVQMCAWKRRLRCVRLRRLAGALCLLLAGGCHSSMTPNDTPQPLRDINAVLADHDDELLAIPGVVGVYVGLMKDEKTPCLKVMLARKGADLERRIPRTLEGHPVVTEVTGEIRPLK